jgi:hypothetical protein
VGAGHKHAPSVLWFQAGVTAEGRDEIREHKLTIISAEHRSRAVAPLASTAQPRVEGIAKTTRKIEVIGGAAPPLPPREAVGIGRNQIEFTTYRKRI